MENQDLIKKADMALADLASGGLLNAEQSNTFIRKIIEQPNMLNENLIRFVPMNSPQKKLEKINFGKRILRAGTEGTALDTTAVDGAFNGVTEATARAKPTFETVTLSSKEVIAEIRMTYQSLEDAIESAAAATNNAPNTTMDGVYSTIIDMLGTRVSADLQTLALTGDTTSSDPYLALVDGWLKNASSNGNTVNAAGATVTKALFKAGLKAMPNQYKEDPSMLYHFLSKDNVLEYVDTLADRATGLGDRYLTEKVLPNAHMGSKVFGASYVDDTEGLLTNPKNLIFGIQRDVSLEFGKDITTRQYIIVITARVDFATEEDEATVYYNNIAAA